MSVYGATLTFRPELSKDILEGGLVGLLQVTIRLKIKEEIMRRLFMRQGLTRLIKNVQISTDDINNHTHI